MSTTTELVIDGNELNIQLDALKLEDYSKTLEMHHQLQSQAFDVIEHKLLKQLADQITKSNAQSVRFINLEALATGTHKDYLWSICGGLAELIDALRGEVPVPLWPNFIKIEKMITVTGTIQNPWILPWHIVAKLDKAFRGLNEEPVGEPPAP